MTGGATFDATGAYRYRLWREWDASLPAVTFIMLNPSTADATTDDPTIRRCTGFAKRWGFGRLEVVNLFAYRADRPAALFAAADPVGRENARHLREACAASSLVVAAWGNNGARATRPGLDGELACLGLTKLGHPHHPLYVPASTTLRPYC
ncbi:MAG: hypothetical protein C0506_09410 [Anaerolinea sp.]|nr:hypothetical protein [Anaerolinea sp.]